MYHFYTCIAIVFYQCKQTVSVGLGDGGDEAIILNLMIDIFFYPKFDSNVSFYGCGYSKTSKTLTISLCTAQQKETIYRGRHKKRYIWFKNSSIR